MRTALNVVTVFGALIVWVTSTGAKPYADLAQLDCPWPKHSFYEQPRRGSLTCDPHPLEPHGGSGSRPQWN